jgi:DNA-directed RNA polymerase specialized sigma54-like protein
MLSLSQRLSQTQKLSPQQIQYQKLLQLNTLALEQRIKTELEMNPVLEEEMEMTLIRIAKKKILILKPKLKMNILIRIMKSLV